MDSLIEKQYLIPFGITREQINETVIHEDVKKPINYGEFTLILFLKKFDNYYVLVDGRWHPSAFSLLISSAFKVPQELIGNMPIDNPLTVLERLANEFGIDITIGDQTSRFIHDARIVIPIENHMGEDLMSVVNRHTSFSENGMPARGNYLGDTLARPNLLGDKISVDVALTYRINVDRYRQYLQSNNLI